MAETTLPKQEAKTVAETTLQQIGNYGKLKAMIGASNFSFDGSGALTFSFKLCSKANVVRIELHWTDTYKVIFSKGAVWKGLQEVETIEDVYAEDLRKVFEDFTGLRLSL